MVGSFHTGNAYRKTLGKSHNLTGGSGDRGTLCCCGGAVAPRSRGSGILSFGVSLGSGVENGRGSAPPVAKIEGGVFYALTIWK